MGLGSEERCERGGRGRSGRASVETGWSARARRKRRYVSEDSGPQLCTPFPSAPVRRRLGGAGQIGNGLHVDVVLRAATAGRI
eukprot:2872995-Pleurochrysis_carterae.AAC.1